MYENVTNGHREFDHIHRKTSEIVFDVRLQSVYSAWSFKQKALMSTLFRFDGLFVGTV